MIDYQRIDDAIKNVMVEGYDCPSTVYIAHPLYKLMAEDLISKFQYQSGWGSVESTISNFTYFSLFGPITVEPVYSSDPNFISVLDVKEYNSYVANSILLGEAYEQDFDMWRQTFKNNSLRAIQSFIRMD